MRLCNYFPWNMPWKLTGLLKWKWKIQLDNYNVVCDKVLLDVILGVETKDKDKIAAIKLWSDLRDRIKTKVVVETEKTVKFDSVTDENLELIINAIKDGNR